MYYVYMDEVSQIIYISHCTLLINHSWSITFVFLTHPLRITSINGNRIHYYKFLDLY
jgi:hypothetical protein